MLVSPTQNLVLQTFRWIQAIEIALLFTIINLVLVIILLIPSIHSIANTSFIERNNKYIYIHNSSVNVHHHFIHAWMMSTLLDHSCLFIIWCRSNETSLRWRCGRWWRSKVRLKQEEKLYLFESFFRNKK